MDLATPHGADLEFRDLNKTDDCPCPQVATTEIKKKKKKKKQTGSIRTYFN